MYVTDLKSRAVTRKSARTERGQTALVSKLRKRVVCIHKLRQRGRAEKLFHSRDHLSCVDKRRRRYLFGIVSLKSHSLTNSTLHSREAYPELVLEQLAHTADTSVSEVVNIVDIAHTLVEVDEVADCRENIFQRDVLGDKLV